MAFTQAQLEALREAYAAGATRVSIDGRTVEYRSLDELSRAIARIERELGQCATDRFSLVRFSRD